ncbi:MAG: phosphate/phosphite/phosphonate ABC transporter substrate-binding protein [Planctomycetota bacterium]
MSDQPASPPTPPSVPVLPAATGVGILLLCLVGLGVLLVAIADPWGRKEGQVGTSDEPVVFVVSPEHARSAGEQGMKALGDFLSERTGLKVQVRTEKSSVEAIDSFKGTADVGLLGLFEYLLARAEHGVEAGVQVLRKDRVDTFAGVVVVRADIKTQKLAELAFTRVAFVSPYSTTGYVFPMKLFADQGVKVEAHFAGSHAEALECLRNNTAAAATTYADHVAGKPEFRVISTTPPIPNEPIFFRKDFERGKRERICSALEYLAGTPEGRALLAKFADITGVRAVTDAYYQEVLGVVAAAGKTIYDVVEDGLSIETRRRYLDLAPR